MIRLGINTMVWSGRFDECQYPLLEQLRYWGYEVVEIPIFDFASLDPVPLRDVLSSSGLAVTVSSALPSDLSLVSDDIEIRRKTRGWLQTAVEKVAAIGGTLLAGPMYAPVGYLPGHRRSDSEWKRTIDEFQELGRAIRGSNVRFAIEPLNRFETYFLNTAEEARRFCEQIADPSVGVLFDTFHANIEEENIPAAFRSLGCWLIHVHLSENHRGIPGSGHVPFREVADALNTLEYDGCAVVESFASSIPELARATAMWRDFAASPDEFARRSLENMRPMFECL
jgi:D-psicose/D-tagatose/L-ribulose 3-epimerase